LNYNRQFGDHNVSAMAGFEQSSEKYEYFSAGRTKYESTAIDQLFAGSADQGYWKNSGSASETARRSYFARVGYDYKSKYMIQFIGRYDGSENFAKDKRWGFFPSVSAGWRISEEGFMDGADWLTNLKIRGSYGEQGNDKISPFQYMTTYDYKTGVYYQQQLGGASVSTILPGTISNPNVTWEVAKTWNIGLDGSVKGEMLSWEIEYFKTRRSNILCNRNATIPIYTGMTSSNLPEENIGIVENQGFEAQLRHGGHSKGGDFRYNIAGNFMYARNKVIFMDETPQPEGYEYLYLTGHPMGSSLYYQCIGINRTEEDLKNYPQMAGSGLGDYIYEDIDKNGKIDAKDMLRSDLNTIPQIVFGLTGNFQYKNFDLSILFQGQALARFHYTPLQAPLEGNITEEMATQSWTLDRTDAKYGRINSTNNRKESTMWLRNASFLRLKNLELGYNFSGKALKSAGIKGLRLYIGGYNLFTITGLKELDPETNNTATYPLMRVFNTGVKVTF
jgi:TonB-linked SusC/RagA family outer membrane protein